MFKPTCQCVRQILFFTLFRKINKSTCVSHILSDSDVIIYNAWRNIIMPRLRWSAFIYWAITQDKICMDILRQVWRANNCIKRPIQVKSCSSHRLLEERVSGWAAPPACADVATQAEEQSSTWRRARVASLLSPWGHTCFRQTLID